MAQDSGMKGLLGTIFSTKKKDEEDKGSGATLKMQKVSSVPKPYPLGPGISTFELPKFRIKYKGVFDLDKVYKGAILWFKEHKFEFHETSYKTKPPELELSWIAERKKSGFIKEVIEIHWHMFEQYPVEVIENGVKKQLYDANFTITMWGAIETDYADIFGEQKWRDSNLKRRMLSFYNRYVVKKELDIMEEDVLYYEMYNLQTVIKKMIGMKAGGSAY